MVSIRFEWDEKKNRDNRRKHGVWFEEATQVFDDRDAIRFYDENHSAFEDRFLLLGHGGSNRLLIVIFCERSEAVIRIISARKATAKETRVYEEGV